MFNVKMKKIKFQQVQWGGPDGGTHLCHFKDALRIKAAPSHLTCAGDRALVCDRHDEARHRARLLLQSGINDVAVAHLRRNEMACECACCLCVMAGVKTAELTLHSVTIQGTFSTLSLMQSYGSSDSSMSFPPSSSDDMKTLGILSRKLSQE